MKVLSRINPKEVYHQVIVKRSSSDEPVISGLSVTPSDIERLARQGVPVSVVCSQLVAVLVLLVKSLNVIV